MKINYLLLFFTFIGIIVVCAILISFFKNKPDLLLSNYATTTAIIGNKIYRIYIADTDQKQEQGLSGVKKLKENEGMLFQFKKPGKYYFWMKDMLIPIDFVFIRDNKVIDTLQSITPETYPKTFTAIEQIDSVIELKDREVTFSKIEKGTAIQYLK